jgi:AcrR family transcriptional regulator
VSPRPQIDHIRRPQILEAAAQVIRERGIGAARIADVADRAGTSGPAILYWFDSKDELLGEALSFAEDRFYEDLTGRLADLEDPAERLRTLIEASVDDYDWTLWMELWTRALRDQGTAERRQHLDDRWREEIIREVRAGQARGLFATEDGPERVAVLLSSLLDGLAVQATLGDAAVQPARMRELTVEIAERLLGAELPAIDLEAASNGSGQPLPAKGGQR